MDISAVTSAITDVLVPIGLIAGAVLAVKACQWSFRVLQRSL